MSRFSIQDESGDRKYFTQIPNMIVNHSNAYEQSLYLIMKRIAGEHGTCYASLNTLAKMMRNNFNINYRQQAGIVSWVLINLDHDSGLLLVKL